MQIPTRFCVAAMGFISQLQVMELPTESASRETPDVHPINSQSPILREKTLTWCLQIIH